MVNFMDYNFYTPFLKLGDPPWRKKIYFKVNFELIKTTLHLGIKCKMSQSAEKLM